MERLKTSHTLSAIDWRSLIFSWGGGGLHSPADGINQDCSCEISDTVGMTYFVFRSLLWDKCVTSLRASLVLLE